MKRRWLKDWPWETVVVINAGLCKEKSALHKPTSDGYEPAQKLWESSLSRELPLRETLDICRQCHRLAPFCFYNVPGNSAGKFRDDCGGCEHTNELKLELVSII